MSSSGYLCGRVHCTHSVSLQWDVVATAVGNKFSLQAIEGGVKSSCKSRVGVQQLSTVSSSACLYSGYLLSPYSCGIRILSAMEYGARSFFYIVSSFPEHNYWSCVMEFQKLFSSFCLAKDI